MSATIYSAYDGGTRFYMSWQLASQDIANNRSLIRWQAGIQITGGWWWGSNSIKIYSVHIDGGSSLGSGTWGNISGAGNHQLLSGSKWVTHNSNGTKSFGANLSAWFTPNQNRSASGSWALPTIPRNSQVSTNDSGNWTLGTPINIFTNRKSTSFTHLIRIRQGSSSGTIIHDINNVGASTTWTPTAGQITTMQNMIPNANSLVLNIGSYNHQVGAWSYVNARTYLREANPTFSDFTFEDSDAATAAITGNNQVLVKGKSTLKVDVSSANKMVAIKGASPVRYAMSYEGKSEQVAYHASNTVTASFTNPQQTGNRTVTVTAFDSRNNATSVSKSLTVYDYAAPVINTKLIRENNFGSDTTIQINGTYSPLTIGTPKNTLTVGSLEYRYKEEYGSFGSWVTRTFTANSTTGTFTSTDTVVSLDNTKKYEFEFRITDSFGTVKTTDSVDVGTPIMFIGENSGTGAIGINKMPENGALDVDGDIYSNGVKVAVSTTPSCRLRIQDSVSMPNNTFTTLSLDSVIHDNAEIADLSNNRITINKTGVYVVSTAARLSISGTARMQLRLYQNSEFFAGQDIYGAGNNTMLSLCSIRKLTSGDHITVQGYQNSGGAGSTNAVENLQHLAVTFITEA
jgi:hypothetical protein